MDKLRKWQIIKKLTDKEAIKLFEKYKMEYYKKLGELPPLDFPYFGAKGIEVLKKCIEEGKPYDAESDPNYMMFSDRIY